MRTLWVGILDSHLLCHSDRGSFIVSEMRDGHTFPISEKLVMRAVTRGGIIRGFGLVVVQTSDESAPLDTESRQQYKWLAEGWMLTNGIGPKEYILFFADDIDQVPDAPEAWA